MKKLFLITILLLFTVVKAQDQSRNTMSSRNSTSTTLDSNGVFTGTVELLRGYNSLSVTVRSDKSSATGGLKILFGKTSTITTANAIKTYSFTYTANDTLFTKTVGVDAPYYKVVYTTGNDSQTVFLLSTMLNAGDVAPRSSDGSVQVSIVGSTGSALSTEATQLLVLEQLQNRINLGGLQTYSSRRGDFTATPKAGGKSVAITGASFTVSYLNFAYGFIRNSTTGAFTLLPNTDVRDSVAGTSIRFDDMASAFSATDVVEIVFIQPEKTIDKALDVAKTIEQAPIWAKYSSDQVTNVAAGGDGASATTRTPLSMEGYKSVSIQKQITVASADTVTISFWASNMASPSTADDNNWVNVDNQFTKYNGGTASTMTAAGDVYTGATTIRNVYSCAVFGYKWLMIKRIVIDGSANSVVITTDVHRQY